MLQLDLILFVLGAFGSFLLDTFWWVKPSFSKYERGGLKNHEHYHFGMELIIVGIVLIIVGNYFSWDLSYAWAPLVGAGFGFIMAEWRQIVEPKKGTVLMGHPFAYGSDHYKESTIIGFATFGVLIGLLVFAVVM